mmetsp:Transcript_2192/g.7676  ORF Transcript_2192/g.7676 Transcript_2192/m.7676 type:complete len:421 (-) Transcript_2192:76-1338(-)
MADAEAPAPAPSQSPTPSPAPAGAGGDETPPGQRGVRYSLVLSIVAILLSIILRSYGASDIDLDTWEDSCPNDFQDECKAHSAVYRVSMATVLTFALQAVLILIEPTLFDQLWSLKSTAWALLVIAFFFTPGEVFDDTGYAWFARIGAFIFIVLQQIILLDLAYKWNALWVEWSGGEDAGNGWLIGLLVVSFILIGGSIGGFVVMFLYFTPCPSNEAVISIVMSLAVVSVIIQLSGENGSLLTSGVMTAYATFLCYSAITLNPRESCNPTLGGAGQNVSIILGMIITLASLTWTAYTASKRIPDALIGASSNYEQTSTLRAVVRGEKVNPTTTANYSDSDLTSTMRTMYLQVTLVFALVSMYGAMVLSNWATLSSDGETDNPRTGDVSLWMQATGAFIALLLYAWSLVAPIIFPDREFGY